MFGVVQQAVNVRVTNGLANFSKNRLISYSQHWELSGNTATSYSPQSRQSYDLDSTAVCWGPYRVCLTPWRRSPSAH